MAIPPKYCLKVGTMIKNRYEILRYISSGGFGITYEAVERDTRRHVAIKELYIKEICNRDTDTITVSVNDINEPTFTTHRRKFFEEANRLKALSHPNIVKVSDVIEANGTAYFVMDYIEGNSLSRESVPMSEEMAMHVINPILDALEYVHNHGLLHLDIKPGNIMIDNHGKAILIDFGTSKVYGDADGNSLSLSSSLAYTPGYAPIEQLSLKTVKTLGTYSDIYAIGATLYYLLTGEKPLLPGEILENDGKLPRINNISAEMQNAIWQATKVVRTTRLATVDQLRRAIKGAVIDVKVEELQRKEDERRRKEEQQRKLAEEERCRDEEEKRRKLEDERRKKNEQRRKTIASSEDTVIPQSANAKPVSQEQKTIDSQKANINQDKPHTSTQKKDNSNKHSIIAVLVTILVIAAIATYLYFNKYNEKANVVPQSEIVDTTEVTNQQSPPAASIKDTITIEPIQEVISIDSATNSAVASPSESPNKQQKLEPKQVQKPAPTPKQEVDTQKTPAKQEAKSAATNTQKTGQKIQPKQQNKTQYKNPQNKINNNNTPKKVKDPWADKNKKVKDPWADKTNKRQNEDD